MVTFCSWSGGKESTLALDRAIRDGRRVDYLLNLVPSRGSKLGHGLPPKFYRTQAKGMGLKIVQTRTSWAGYGKDFAELIRKIRPSIGIFGDVYLQDHRDWVERKAKELGFEAIEPLWDEKPLDLYREFLDGGFEGIVVKVNPSKVSPEWLGHSLDRDLLAYLRKNGVCPIGENGEYHTATLGGPIFKRRIRVELGSRRKFGDNVIVDIKNFELV